MLAEGDSAEDKLIDALVGEAVKTVFARYADLNNYDEIALQFKGGVTLQVGDDVPTDTMLENYTHIKGLRQAAAELAEELDLDSKDPAAIVSAGEFILEGLYVNNRLSKGLIRGKIDVPQVTVRLFAPQGQEEGNFLARLIEGLLAQGRVGSSCG